MPLQQQQQHGAPHAMQFATLSVLVGIFFSATNTEQQQQQRPALQQQLAGAAGAVLHSICCIHLSSSNKDWHGAICETTFSGPYQSPLLQFVQPDAGRESGGVVWDGVGDRGCGGCATVATARKAEAKCQQLVDVL